MTALSRTTKPYLKEFHEEAGRFVLGLRTLTESKSYGFDALKRKPVINDEFDGKPVVVVFRPESAGGRAFVRQAKDQALNFKLTDDPNRMKDAETGSTWNLETGKCESGNLEGSQLEEIPAVVSFRRVWEIFYPENERYGG